LIDAIAARVREREGGWKWVDTATLAVPFDAGTTVKLLPSETATAGPAPATEAVGERPRRWLAWLFLLVVPAALVGWWLLRRRQIGKSSDVP
jgi:hypothetical protein